MPDRRLRTACVQLSPCFKDWETSRRRADALIGDLRPGELDLLVLPEMALTGYCFQSKADVEPFVEEAGTGRTLHWAAETASRLECYVIIGLPTVDDPQAPDPTYRNSLLVVSPEGSLVHTYHKTFLYGELTNDRADYLWAEAGTGFVALDLPFPASSPCRSSAGSGTEPDTFRIVPGICMDFNMPTFESPFDRFELGTFADEHGADLVVGAMSWLDSEPPLVEEAEEGDADYSEGLGRKEDPRREWEQVKDVLAYWVLRLSPLIGSGAAFVCANRVGREGTTVFTGSSCALQLDDRPMVLEHAGKRKERVVVACVSLPSRAAK